jgi:hypothetical protein
MRRIASFLLTISFLAATTLLSSCSRSIQTDGRIYPVLASPTKAKAGGISGGIGLNNRTDDPSGNTYAPTITAQGLFFYTLNSWLFTEGSFGIGAGKSKETSGYSATISPGIGVYRITGRVQFLASLGLSYYGEDNSITLTFTDLNGNPIDDATQTIKMRYSDLYLKLGMKVRLDEANRIRLTTGLYTLKNIKASSEQTAVSNGQSGPYPEIYLLGQPNYMLVQSALGLEIGAPDKLNGFIQAGFGLNESPNPNKGNTNFFSANRLQVTAGVALPLSF